MSEIMRRIRRNHRFRIIRKRTKGLYLVPFFRDYPARVLTQHPYGECQCRSCRKNRKHQAWIRNHPVTKRAQRISQRQVPLEEYDWLRINPDRRVIWGVPDETDDLIQDRFEDEDYYWDFFFGEL
jgi:hypothetical protein